MKQKITLILLAMLLILIGKTDAVTLTQKMGDGYLYRTLEPGDEVTLKSTNKKGYSFESWTVETENVSIDPKSSVVTFTMPNSDVTIKANYKTSSSEVFTITYNPNGGTGVTTEQKVPVGESVTLSANGFARDRFTFAGWSLRANGEILYLNKDTITPTSNLTLYAVWVSNAQIISNVVKVGDYVKYNPIVSNYAVPTTASGHTADQTFNPSQTTLWKVFSINQTDGTIELISADSAGQLTLKGSTGYQYVVQTLKDLSEAYINTNFAIDARPLGYSEAGLTPYKIAQYKTSAVANDNQYTPDQTILNSNPQLVQYTGTVWLASRYNSNYVRTLSNTANFSYSSISSAVTYGFRPIVKIDARTEIIAGDGVENKPYEIKSFASVETFAINYNANGGTGIMATEMATKGSEVTLQTNKYAKQYYTFRGWSTSPNGALVYTDGEEITVNGNLTLYAVWEQTTFLVSFDKNTGTGTMATQEIKKGVSTPLTTTTFSKTYYKFIGWAKNDPNGTVLYTDSQSVIINEDMTLYAVWELIEYTITYNANGGSGSMAPQVGDADKNMTLTSNTFTNSGYDFGGWATTATGTASYSNNASFRPTKDMTLYAVWGHTITFNGNGSTGGSTTAQVIKHNTAQTLKYNGFTRTGYSFAGWSTTATGSVAYSNGGSMTITSDTTLYAQWKIVLSYDANGGSGAPSSQGSTAFGTTALSSYKFTISSTAPTKRGGSFQGWATSSTATSAQYASGSTITITTNTTLYAVWGTACYCCGSTPSKLYERFGQQFCSSCYNRSDLCSEYLYCGVHNSNCSSCYRHNCNNECETHSDDVYYCDECDTYYCYECDCSCCDCCDSYGCDCEITYVCSDPEGNWCWDYYCSCGSHTSYYCSTCDSYYCYHDLESHASCPGRYS